MLIGTARPDERESFDVQGHDLEEIKAHIAARVPQNWELISAPLSMGKRDVETGALI